MSGSPSPAGRARLCMYRFGPDARFEGGLVGALERMGPDDGPRVLDALFVALDPAGGELQAIDLGTALADGSIAALLDFRLDPRGRRAATQRTLAAHAGGVPPSVVDAIAAALEPGDAILAVLIAGGTAGALDEAVSRTGGRMVADEPVEARGLADLAEELRSAL